jgi:hypothetical protein
MSAQLPFPSFEDIRRVLQFWLDQQDKWFYFEGATLQSGSTGEVEAPNPLHSRTMVNISRRDETVHYLQTRIVGKIGDVVSYPPTLLLHDAVVFTAQLSYQWQFSTSIVSKETRRRYGLVFSQITYYEPIDDHEKFLDQDTRVSPPD